MKNIERNKISENGMPFRVHGLVRLILWKWPSNQKKSTDSIQFSSKFQDNSLQFFKGQYSTSKQ